MKINEQQVLQLIALLDHLQLLNQHERRIIKSVTAGDFIFSQQLGMADSLHFHIHVADVEALPTEAFSAAVMENSKEGYIKYALPGGIKLIFSHIAVAQPEQVKRNVEQSYLDHIGIDIRSDTKEAYIIFQQIPRIAAQHDYFFTRQGDGVAPVKCCHMQVKEKYWVYAGEYINYEFAFGPLVVYENGFGVDLRPANPFNKAVIADSASCCGDQPKAKIFI